jgi:hypothetical protein
VLHHQAVPNRQRAVQPERVPHLRQGLRARVASGDPRGRVDTGRGEEDQEHQDADGEQHEDGGRETPHDEAEH